MIPHTPFIYAPAPQTHEQRIAWRSGVFTDAEIDKIEAYCSNLELSAGTIGSGATGAELERTRKSSVGWVHHLYDTAWIYRRFMDAAQRVNADHLGFDLWGQVESIQYTVYQTESAHYDWHRDAGKQLGAAPRKLSVVMQLSDPTAYDGGDLQVWESAGPEAVRRERGFMSFFPSYTPHRVTPVTRGIRKSLVAWVSGPQFR